ncbi:MAG TPA: cupin domain-containing protein [Terriglobales bacterium]|jgi:quercetin dioxygenase-like cupin family protein
MKRRGLLLIAFLVPAFVLAQTGASPVKSETLLSSTSSWDGTPYRSYPLSQPQITVLKITLAPHTTMKWHSHPMPNAAYVVCGDLTVEKKDGTRKHFTAGQVVGEVVETVHRGITGDQGVVLIVFYPGTPGMPLSH